MLDDLKYIHEKDVQDALGIASKQPEQLTHDFKIKAKPFNEIENIVYAGMGGSALAALLTTSYPGYSVPFEVSRQYDIPHYVSKKTLFIAASYSGNTEETLSGIAQAEKAGAQIVVIAGGGKLQEIAEKKKYLFIQLPKAEQPRYAVFYNYTAILQLLGKSKLFANSFTVKDIQATAKFLHAQSKTLFVDVPTKQNPAKQLALELMGKSMVVYSGPFLSPAAYKWKISFNENAKSIAWQGTLPEFSHNEFIGWSSHPVHKPYAVIDLRSSFDNAQIQKRFDISAQLLSGKRPHPHTITAEGKSKLEQLLWIVLMGDFTSIYLGLLNGLNPTPVDLVEKMKKLLV